MAPKLIALDLPGGPEFVVALQRIWDRGDAAFPLDRRLPAPARAAMLAAMRPASVIDEHGIETPCPDAVPVEPGDAVVVATSGSTGDPKGVVLTHDAVANSARSTSAGISVDPATDHWLCCNRAASASPHKQQVQSNRHSR